MSLKSVYRNTDAELTFEVRNDAGSLIDLTGYSSVKMVIGTTAYENVASIDGTGLDGTGDYNVSVTIANGDPVWDSLTASSYLYQINLTDNLSNITIPIEGRLTIRSQIPAT